MATLFPNKRAVLRKSRLNRWQFSWSSLFAPVDIASLVYFRITFGAIMLWEVWRYFEHGWIGRYWIDPVINFPYFGWTWLQPLPGSGMYLLFIGLGILAVCIALGFWYRISTILFFLGFTYAFLLEEGRYLNHFYLICLISFLLIFIPAHRTFSLDARRWRRIRSQTAPAWTLWLLQLQLAIPYFYGGIAKLNGDWLQGEPMRMWMAARTDFPVIGFLFTREWMVYFLSYGGLLLDLLVVPFLLWRRTRPVAFAVAVLFHLMNARLFSIGIFPWFMIAATMMFFPPDWPRRLWRRQGGQRHRRRAYKRLNAATLSKSTNVRQSITLGLLSVYVAFQLLFPLRHYFYPGNVSWTEEGHRFAWHMKLRTKKADAVFMVVNQRDNTVRLVYPEEFLPGWLVRKMTARPYMILQFSHFLAEEFGGENPDDIAVQAQISASLNGREYQRLIDPNVDLTQQQLSIKPSFWIVPLKIPLSPSLPSLIP